MASVFPLFGSAFFRNLGLGPGSSLLAGISIGMMPIYFVSLQFEFDYKGTYHTSLTPSFLSDTVTSFVLGHDTQCNNLD